MALHGGKAAGRSPRGQYRAPARKVRRVSNGPRPRGAEVTDSTDSSPPGYYLQSMSNRAEKNKDVVRAFVDAVNRQDWDRVATLVAPEFTRHSHAAGSPGVRSRGELLRFLQAEFETFPDAREEIADILAEGDRVAVRHSFRGTQAGPMGPYPPSGRIMSADYLAIYRLENGVIVEAWAEWDNQSGLVQLGHVQR